MAIALIGSTEQALSISHPVSSFLSKQHILSPNPLQSAKVPHQAKPNPHSRIQASTSQLYLPQAHISTRPLLTPTHISQASPQHNLSPKSVERRSMAKANGLRQLHRILFVPTFAALFFACLNTDSVNAECGVLPAQDASNNIVLNPGEVVNSCSGRFTLIHEDNGSVTLQHTPTGQILWQVNGQQGQAYAFNSLSNSGLDGNVATLPSPNSLDLTGNTTPPPKANDWDPSGNQVATPTPPTPPTPEATNAASNLALLPPQTDPNPDSNAESSTFPQTSNGDSSAVPSEGWQLDSNVATSNTLPEPLITKRREVKKRYNSFAAPTARLNVQDDGNIIISDGGASSLWTSNTKGTDCNQRFFTDAEKEALASKAESVGGSNLASVIREDPCALLKVEVDPYGGQSQEVTLDLNDPINLTARAAKKGRTVVNEYEFVLKLNPSSPQGWVIPIGTARLTKTWFFDGRTVSNAWGAAPDKASVDGETNDIAMAIGYHFGYIGRGSELDVFSDYHNQGRGAHTSTRRVLVNFESQFLRSIYQYYWTMRQELYVKSFADGKVKCRGGTHCEEVQGP